MNSIGSFAPPDIPDGIAIIGMAGRFPGARNVGEFWRNLVEGAGSISFFDRDQLEDAFSTAERSAENFVPARAILDDIDRFDAAFFGMHASEAELTDPQQRIFLECAWEALEDGGCDPSRVQGAVGVFAGSSPNSYFLNQLCQDRAAIDRLTSGYQVSDYPTLLGSSLDFLATRVAYKLDLRGPAVTVQTACSTSLVAVAQACQSLLCYGCDAALAGGVSITLPQQRGYFHQEGGMVSRDGTCRPFDAAATGTVFGSGAGVVLLKRLEDALAHGDPIYAVIKGSAINNDGASKVGFAAPSIQGQAAAITAALEAGGVDPRSISYVECHGTATKLGDPIEIAALTRAYRRYTDDSQFCAIGSVKGNVGHLDAAAGVTGLIKTALALHHQIIPGTLNFRTPNPEIDFSSSPFFVNDTTRAWSADNAPRRAAVSAFGVGGTNAHVVLEEAPLPLIPQSSGPSRQVFVVSARSEPALVAACQKLADFLRDAPDSQLDGIAHTLQTGRREFDHRASFVGRGKDDLVEALSRPRAIRSAATGAPPVAFMFPGQGAQYPRMAARLYETYPAFREPFDRCHALLSRRESIDIRDVLYADVAQQSEEQALNRTLVAQPALFAVEYALAQLWMDWGIRPDRMIGHSLGEIVAATLAGVFTLDEVLAFVAERARLMQTLPDGTMLAVRLPEREVKPFLDEELSLAAANAPQQCIVAGPTEAIGKLESRLREGGVATRRLQAAHAFHSHMVEPVVAPLTRLLETMSLKAPEIPFVSCVTGDWITPELATSPGYWGGHYREPVRFSDALRTLLEGSVREAGPVLLEVGPGHTLASVARQGRALQSSPTLLTSLPAGADEDELSAILGSLGTLWSLGLKPKWAATRPGGTPRRVSLPTYPFERHRYWKNRPMAEQPTRTLNADPLPEEASSPLTETTMTRPSEDSPQFMSMGTDSAEVVARVTALIEEMTGEPIPAHDSTATFVGLGLDSLFLSQLCLRLESEFGVKIAFRQLLGQVQTIAMLSDHIAAHMPLTRPAQPEAGSEGQAESVVSPETPSDVSAVASSMATAGVLAVFHDKISAMSRLLDGQLEALKGIELRTPAKAHEATNNRVAVPPQPDPVPSRFVGLTPNLMASGASLSSAQQAYVDALCERLNRRTPGSKAYTAAHRAVLADPRVAAGFNDRWKEIVYPLVTDRAKGSRIWDIDGNDYIDLVNGFGPVFFGHSPDFILDAIQAQLRTGFAIGPQTPRAGAAARLLCDITGNERAVFCNTGSEAVMAALRIARTVTGRERVVIFRGAYHGQFDEVLAKPGRASAPGATPVAAGIPAASLGNMVVLEYATPEALAWIRTHASELAAVLVEPVQSRHPALQPRAFLQELRSITAAAGAALIFDEVVTGFRTHPGGVQALFDIRADLVTYGKVVGGGMPIGVLAGKAAFMDALDGGNWEYGDESAPEARVTFVAGTFVRHPLTLAAAQAVLEVFHSTGPALQHELSDRTARLVTQLNDILSTRGLRTRVESFSSFFHVNFSGDGPLASLLYYDLRACGLHILEGFPCFLTTAHSEQDLERIRSVFEASIIRAQDAGILPLAASSLDGTKPATPLVMPLTEAQTEIWLAAQMSDEASCAFNESVRLTFHGRLDVNKLQTALDDVIRRHDALRVHFDPTGSSMSVRRDLVVPIRQVETDEDEALEQLVGQDAAQSFDLTGGPLPRATLARRFPDLSVLILTVHHIVCDGWSTAVLLRELAHCYSARCSGQQPALPEPASFGLYAVQQTGLSQNSAGPAERYWLDAYAEPIPPLELPTDRPRGATKSYRGATAKRTIDFSTYRSLKRFAAAQDCTLVVVLLAAFQLSLGRLSRSEDVVVGIPMAGQPRTGTDPLIGHCINFLPIRGRWSGSTTVAGHLAATKQALLEAYENQDYTLGTLVRKLRTTRDPSRLPLVEVQFNLDRLDAELSFSGLRTLVEANPKQAVNFDLFFNLVESAAGLMIECDYNTDLLDAATVHQWMDFYVTCLDQVVDHPSCTISSLALLDRQERRLTLDCLNRTAQSFPRESTIHDLIVAQAGLTPDAIAARFGEQVLTYRQLDERTNRLAHHLRRVIDAEEARVGILIDRSLEMLVAVISVLKAGYSYVPIDPRSPVDRQDVILQDAAADAILIDRQPDLVRQYPVRWTCNLATDAQSIETESDEPPLARTQPDRLAYIIYTSGSSGTPKGVCVSHRSVVNLLCDITSRVAIGSTDRLLAITTLAFDISVLELLAPLCVGAETEIASSEEARDGEALRSRVERSGATIMRATPTTWSMLLDAGFQPSPRLKMLCGGELLPRALADQLLENHAELWNLYGPTETTIWSTAGRVLPGDGTIAVGFPIANTAIYIVDQYGQLLPIGIAGELLIFGDGVAQGYLNRPELDAERFIDNPFDRLGVPRLYRTGDLARHREDGQIEILGRLDNQIKLRGFRIETGEIESAMTAIEGISAAAVVLDTTLSDNPRLAAYYVEKPGYNHTAVELRQDLAQVLPDYMIPAFYTRLDRLPHRSTGKLDRQALVANPLGEAPETRGSSPPGTAMERAVLEIWQQVLRRQDVGIESDLFDLGADSIHIFQITARLKRLGLPTAAKDVTRRRTIKAFCDALTTSDQAVRLRPLSNSVDEKMAI